MTLFIVLAATMTLVAVALLAWPLYRSRAGAARGTWMALALTTLCLPLGAAALYHRLSNWSWDPKDMAAADNGQHAVGEMVAKLEAHLKDHAQDVEGWLLLGRSRLLLNNLPGATEAFAAANKAANGTNVDALVAYGEVLAMQDPNSLRSTGGELFEAALKLDATNPKALFYGGMAEAIGGEGELARSHWITLVRLPLPAEVRAVVAARIAELDQQLGRPPDPEIARLVAAGAPAAEAGVADGTAAGPAGPAAAAPVTVGVHVSIAAALAAQVPAGALLFVLARDPSQPGPPFAAKRLATPQLPLDVTLTEQDAMLPGRTLRQAHRLVIVARFSRSGAPQAASGDLYGEAAFDPAAGGPLAIVIDKVVP